jgi:mannosyl-3-phosphoglycerate phosphatase
MEEEILFLKGTSVYSLAQCSPAMQRIIIYSDLDGCLLDATDYSFDAANEALSAIQQLGAPLILVSSKTRAEVEPLRLRLEHLHPFIVENGGALYVPRGYFPFPLENSTPNGDYDAVAIGTPYASLRAALKEIGRDLDYRLRGFGDMSVEEVARLTGLSPADAFLATQREYDEPFVVDGPAIAWSRLLKAAEARGLQCTRGGRFYHLMGASDKGIASRRLMEWYRRLGREDGGRVVTVGLGDSLNDLPMLAVVDHPILVQRPDRSYDPDVQLPHLIRAVGVGPVGWNRSLVDLLPTL